MPPGAITSHIDVAQLAFWIFFLGFLGLVYYLRREDHREGYPLHDPDGPPREGFPERPPVYQQLRLDGTMTQMPHYDPDPPMSYRAAAVGGDPSIPIGNKLTAAIGPGTYTMRRDEPFRTHVGQVQVQPLRVATDWRVAAGESDPRGMRVTDIHYHQVGVVTDVWIDRDVKIIKYLEIALDAGTGVQPLLVPIFHTSINEAEREVRVTALRASQFQFAPRPRSPDQITAREEDMVNGFYAGGRFYVNDFEGETTR